jgi:chromosome segregation ATPase
VASSKHHKSRGVKQGGREVEALHLEKKQLELVIGNSMRKIEELLNNEITLKKTIHELKTQIDGKGGISMEYEKTIRNLQKNEEELQS